MRFVVRICSQCQNKTQEFGYFNAPELVSDQGTENVNSIVIVNKEKEQTHLVLQQAIVKLKIETS